jgi:hypothetical protein
MTLQKHERWAGISDARLSHEYRASGWIIFRSVYWALCLIALFGIVAYFSAANAPISLQVLMGFAFVILAVFLVPYGIMEAHHSRFMSRYGRELDR